MAKLNEVLRIVSLGGPTRQPSTYKKMTHMMMMNNRKTHLNMISTMCGCPWPSVAFGVLPDVIPKTIKVTQKSAQRSNGRLLMIEQEW